ncbi:MAG: amidase [Pseudomonadota bacterium]
MEIHDFTLSELCRRLKSGELAATAVAEHMLARIDALNPRLRAYTVVTAEQALAAAAELDARRQRGEPLGLLHGVPIGLKDLLATRGVVTASGTRVMAGQVPDHDATVVERLRDAGAIALGKLQLTEGAYGSHHPELPPPVNPWSAEAWPGVSSSGSGVAVAARLAFAALGTDTGGSIRFPSAANGIVGVKPTYGRVSRHGAFPLAESLDHIGPMARTVEDAARVLQVLAGHDARDPNALTSTVPDYLAGLDDGIEGWRFGIDWAYVETGVDPEVVTVVRDFAAVLRERGAEIVEIELPEGYRVLSRNWVVTCGAECASAHEGMWPEQSELYGPDLGRLIEFGHRVGALQYAGLERVRERFRVNVEALFARNGLSGILCPALIIPTPSVEQMDETTEDDDRTEFITFTAPFNYSGHPTLTLPTGLAPNGLPQSVQIVGALEAEATLLKAGQAAQQSLAFMARPSV